MPMSTCTAQKKDLSGLSLGFHKRLMRNDCFQLLYVWKTENRGEHLGILTCLKYKSQMNHGFVRKVELMFDSWKERTLNVKLTQMKWNRQTARIEPRAYRRGDMIPCQSMGLNCIFNFQQYTIISVIQGGTGYRCARSIVITASSATLAFEVQSLPKPAVGSGFFSPLPGTR